MKDGKNKKKCFVWFFALLAAIVGAAVAVGAYLKKKAEKIGENLDYDGDIYFEDDDYYDDDDSDEDGSSDSEASEPEADSNDNADSEEGSKEE